jgi:hypothetical protein
MHNPHALATLAFSVVIFVLSVGVASLGTHRDSLFADPGRPDAAASPETASSR